jgi:nucleotide-binding universal stress UspA family protein
MFPKTLTTALFNYLQIEMGWARCGICNGDPDADTGGSEEARMALVSELEGPYPAGGEPLMTAVRDFIKARAVFDRCSETRLDQAVERLEEAQRDLVEQIRSADVARGVTPRPYNTVLVALQDDEQAEHVVHVAGDLARILGGVVVILHVVQPLFRLDRNPLVAQRRHAAHRGAAVDLLARAQRWLPGEVPVERMLREGVPSAQIVAGAKSLDANLIVIGTRCQGRLAHFLLGSTSEAVMRDADCPVVTVGPNGPWAPSLRLEHRAQTYWPRADAYTMQKASVSGDFVLAEQPAGALFFGGDRADSTGMEYAGCCSGNTY